MLHALQNRILNPTIHAVIYSKNFQSNSPKEKEMRTEHSRKEKEKMKNKN